MFLTPDEAKTERLRRIRELGKLMPPIWDTLKFMADARLLNPFWHFRGLLCSASVDKPDGDSGTWLHVSFSRVDSIPSHADLLAVRKAFFAPTVCVVQVFPPKAEYVNMHSNCLHLWQRLDARAVPDLRIEDLIAGKSI